jgi:hypothetical protein
MDISDGNEVIDTTTTTTQFSDDTDHSMSEGSSESIGVMSSEDDSQTYDLGGATNSATINFNDFDSGSSNGKLNGKLNGKFNGKFNGDEADEATVELFDADGHSLGTQTITASDLDSDGNITINSDTEFSSMKVTATQSDFTIDSVEANISSEVSSTSYSYDITLNAGLSDTDGSETLSSITLDNLPAGVTLTDASGNEISANSDGTYTVETDSNGDTTVTLTSNEELAEDTLGDITASVTAIETMGTDDISDDISATVSATDDEFVFNGDDFDLDFDNIDDGALTDINSIDLTDGSHELTNIDASDIMDMTGEANTLTIFGGEDDTVSLDTDTWSQGDVVTVDGNTFTEFTADIGGSGAEEVAKLLIDNNVQVDQS